MPVAVGAVIAWLATLGITLDDATTNALVVGVTGLATAGYYTAVRLVENRWPAAGRLLGVAGAPVYGPDPGPDPQVREEITKICKEGKGPVRQLVLHRY
ncbi:MAG: hypothetical protein QOE54_926 [Streptosporangiaceae bacterium]|nr:hypothetical protein [Streptosporangiaceae bacterium]MDX6428560.1 hypothetical protein [Streptosporangiaceae bacterium]